jgi:hypothetical protein
VPVKKNPKDWKSQGSEVVNKTGEKRTNRNQNLRSCFENRVKERGSSESTVLFEIVLCEATVGLQVPTRERTRMFLFIVNSLYELSATRPSDLLTV